MQLFPDCWEPLLAPRRWQCSTWRRNTAHGAYAGVGRPGIFASVLSERLGAFFLGQTLISILHFVVVFCWLPASACFTILLQWCLPNMLALRDFFLFLFWSHQCEMYSETLIAHSPLPVSKAGVTVWTEFPGLWLPRTMSLSSPSWWWISGQPHLFKTSQAGILVLGEDSFVCL